MGGLEKSGFRAGGGLRRGWIMAMLLASSCVVKEPIIQPAPAPLPKDSCSPHVRGGFTDRVSYFPGDSATVFLHARNPVTLCRLDIYDVNGTVVSSVPSSLFPQQSPDTTEAGYHFTPTVKIQVPPSMASGIYLIDNKIPFIVKTRQRVDITIIYPVNTTNAYCHRGGKSLYSVDRPHQVSFLRPISIQSQSEFCLKWFSSLNDIQVGYVSDLDMDFDGAIELSKIVVIPGHSEYWTRAARLHFDKFVNNGGHAIILSGNTMWWQVRYSADYTKMICYKNAQLDPETDPLLKTINWNRDELHYSILSSIGADFQHGGYGLQVDAGWDGFKIVTPGSPLLRGLGLRKGDILHFPSGEYDGAPIQAFDPDGFPLLNTTELNFEKIELIGFDKGSRARKETIGTFVVFQKSKSSGIVVNAASYDWCSYRGMGSASGESIKKITRNAIDLLLKDQSVFSK
jgi:hypothetical protein